MSDNIFINAYVENALGTLHEQTNLILTLKTQLKISQDSLAGKESVIQNLNNKITELQNIITQKDSQIETNAIDTNEYNRAIANASSWEQSYNQMAAKVSHMDTLMKQLHEMKDQFKQKDTEISRLNNDNKELINFKELLSQKEAEIDKLNDKLKKIVAKDVMKKKASDTKKEINNMISESNFVSNESNSSNDF